MIKILNVSLLLLASSLAVAQTAPPTSTAAQRDAANQAGLYAGTVGGTLAPKTDAAGNVLKDANGNPVYQQNSRAGMSDMLKIFQKNTGLEDISPEQSPTNGTSPSGIAGVATSNSVDFACPVVPDTQVAAGSYSFKVKSCVSSGATITSVVLTECTNRVNGGFCTSNSDYSTPFSVSAGVYGTRGNTTYGLACNVEKTCRLTVKGSFRYGGNSDSMQAGGGITNGTATNRMHDSLTTGTTTAINANGQTMGGAMAGLASSTTACLELQRQALESGRVVTCDTTDPQVAKYASPTTSKTLEEALGIQACTPNVGGGGSSTTTTQYNRTCSRNTAMTEKTTNYSIASELYTCYLGVDESGKTETWPGLGSGMYRPEAEYCKYAEPANEGQGPGRPPKYYNNMDKLDGYTLVGVGAQFCEHSTSGKDRYCDSYVVPRYYAKLGARVELSSSATPSAVAGVCESDPNSDSYIETCAGDGWFGRTLPAAECTATYAFENGAPTTLEESIDFRSKPGCGVCIKPVVRQSCVGTPTPDELAEGGCSDIPASCTLTSSVAETFNTPGGIPTTIRDTYSCVSTTVINAAPTSSSCVAEKLAGDHKVVNPANDAGSFNEAMVTAAVADQTARGIDAEGSGMDTMPKIFGGTYARCSRPVGTFGGWLQRNCCDTGLRRAKKGNVIKNGCSLDDVKLATNRREGFSVYIGDWCSNSIRILTKRKCIERTEGYCMFPGILPKLVQEQGRQQLAERASSSTYADVSRGTVSYNYTSGTANGAWSAPVQVGGARIAGWQWPAYCSDSNEIARKRKDGEEVMCPGYVQTYVAVCENNGCGTLPEDPTINGSLWSMVAMDPLATMVRSATEHTTLKGACDTANGTCQYTASVWPVGKGGRAYTNRNLSWQLYSTQSTQTTSPTAGYVGSKTVTTTRVIPGHWYTNDNCVEKCQSSYVPEKVITVEEQVSVPQTAAYVYNLTGVGNMEFKAEGLASGSMLNAPLPSTVGFQYSLDAGANWTRTTIPTDASAGYTIPGTEIQVVGGCDKLINLCSYTLSAPIIVTTKPWGSPEGPDCSGFTAGQLAVLDFGKMDLSAFTARAMANVAKNNPITNAATVAAQEVAEFNSLMSSNKVKASVPNSGSFARVSPANGLGPFNVRVAMSSFYPETKPGATNRVLGLAIDWDDCRGYQQVPVTTNGIFVNHTYSSPEDYASCKPDFESGILHRIKLQVQTVESGVINTTLEVHNGWNSLNEFKGKASADNDQGVIKSLPTTPKPF